MRNINFPLLIGGIIVIFLIIVAFYPGLLTANDPLFEESPKQIEYKSEGEWISKFGHNPMPPNKENLLGTDDAGRDVYARLVYGTRNTLKLALLIAIFRMLLALPLGLAAGMGVSFISSAIKAINTYFTAIPMLIFSYIVLNIGYFRMLQMDNAILAFAIVLTIVGWAKLAGMIEDSTRRVLEEDFIEGEVAIGKTKLQIAYQNIIPHIIPTSISLFFKEMGMALFLIAQLAVLNVFVGVTREAKTLAFKANYGMILEPEWGGILSRISYNIRRYESVYWITFYPIVVFSIAIVGINLTGEGLRIEFMKRESRVISSIRKAYYLLSPRMFISQIMDFKKYYKPVIAKTMALILIIAYFVIPWNGSHYKFNLDYAKLHLQELTKDEYKGRVTGSEGGYLAGEYIINTLEDYGYQVNTLEIPLTMEDGDTHIILTPMIVESGWIKVTNDEGDVKTYQLHKDFSIATINENLLKNKQDEFHVKGFATERQNNEVVPEGLVNFSIERSFNGFSVLGYKTINQMIVGANSPMQIILAPGLNRQTNTYLFKSTSIIPYEALRLDIEEGYRQIELVFDYPLLPQHPARNITGFLPGKGKTMEDPGELIIIGASYDGVYLGGAEASYTMTATPAATALEVARALSLIDEPLDKSIQFIFWDNEFERITYSPIDGSHYYHVIDKNTISMAMTHGYYYFDISYPGFNGNEKHLNLITFPAQIAGKNNYLIGMGMEKRLKNMNIKYRRFHYDFTSTNSLQVMRLNALTSVGVGNPSTAGINSSFDTMENINYKRLNSIGQVIIDTMTMNPHIMD